MAPFALNCYDYGPSSATLYLYDDGHNGTDVWTALQAYADRYGTQITTRPATSAGTVLATVAFDRDGVRYEVSAVMRDFYDDEQTGPDEAA